MILDELTFLRVRSVNFDYMLTDNSSKAPDLVRCLGVWSSTAVVTGGVMGTGIFLVTSQMAREVGSVSGVVAAWLVEGVVVLLGTFGFAELGAALPKAGGDYVYLSRVLDKTAAVRSCNVRVF